ncbi:ferredoxin [Streptomyces nodosus]|uniref:ferredoxin n=1 Tax=Streptomyces nodosus TaxID=40318 RepID=UPI001F38CA64|nr:ferredoxin [Streptomyces sp. SID2888]
MMVHVNVDVDRCVGAGQCVLTASDVFDQDDDGLVTVLAQPSNPATVETVREAAVVCPSMAITVVEN